MDEDKDGAAQGAQSKGENEADQNKGLRCANS